MSHGSHTVTVRVKVARDRSSDLLLAISDDMPGLMVPARSEEELKPKIAPAVREILEAQGHQVLGITADYQSDGLPADFVIRGFVAAAQVTAA